MRQIVFNCDASAAAVHAATNYGCTVPNCATSLGVTGFPSAQLPAPCRHRAGGSFRRGRVRSAQGDFEPLTVFSARLQAAAERRSHGDGARRGRMADLAPAVARVRVASVRPCMPGEVRRDRQRRSLACPRPTSPRRAPSSRSYCLADAVDLDLRARPRSPAPQVDGAAMRGAELVLDPSSCSTRPVAAGPALASRRRDRPARRPPTRCLPGPAGHPGRVRALPYRRQLPDDPGGVQRRCADLVRAGTHGGCLPVISI